MKKNTAQPLTEMEAYQIALSKINLREAVAPVFRGKIVEDEDTYNKVQQLLDCPQMEHAHKFLLDVDFDDLSQEIKQKVDDLYELAISQEFIKADQAEEDEVADEVGQEAADIAQPQVSDNSGGFENESIPNPGDAATKDSIQVSAPEMNTCAFVLFYSAMKHGDIKTGECYSNATTLENAKLDALQKLKKFGFTAIEIIAAEECDPNARGCAARQPDDIQQFGEKSFEETKSTTESDEEKDTEEDEVEEKSAEEPEKEDEEKDEEEEKEDVKDAVPAAAAKKEADNAKPDEDEAEEEKNADDAEETAEEEPEEKDEEPAEDEASDDSDDEDLSRSKKLELFKEYLNEFKNLLQKMKSETYAEMSLANRAKFYDEMSKIWKDKPDPSTFMTDDNVDQIEHMKIKIAK